MEGLSFFYNCAICLFVVCACFQQSCRCADVYIVDVSAGLGRRFDGIGAISGGGATSKLLVNYPEPQRSQVLDFLFKPGFGASLHTLKVEIGGDAQSSEGTESSHMHESWDENYHRGYEWWLMREAKKRNPAIQLSGLPWGFPGWLGHDTWWPFWNRNATADYVARWVLGAKKWHGLRIDYVGIWNEKPYDVSYIKVLRAMLNERGLASVKIVAADMIGLHSWDIAKDIRKDKLLDKSVDVIGAHYAGTYSSREAQRSRQPLWSSEDYSTVNNETGGGCMARIINQNYVNGLMTSTIAWNLLASYYDGLAHDRHGLMTAQQPWSGHYEVNCPIWAAAHTTQFTAPGWYYLRHGEGVGRMRGGGSFVSLISPDRKDLTVVIETMDTTIAWFCVRPPQSPEKVKVQNVTFLFRKNMENFTTFHLWRTHFGLGGSPSTYFMYSGTRKVLEGRLTLTAEVNSIYTLTTLKTGVKGSFPPSPASQPFPSSYSDSFDGYAEFSEPDNFAQQVGVFEIRRRDNNPVHGQVMRQVSLRPPIHWCPNTQIQPLTLIGADTLEDVTVIADVLVGRMNATDGVFIAARVDHASCTTFLAKGIFFFLLVEQRAWQLSHDLARIENIKHGRFKTERETWYQLGLQVKGAYVIARIDGHVVYNASIPMKTRSGFVALGTNHFGLADFDNFHFTTDV